MRGRVEIAIDKIKINGWDEMLRECMTTEEKHKKLAELLPEVSKWDISIARQQLYFYILNYFGINLGVCHYFTVDDYRRYCHISGRKIDCNCVVPQIICVIRDQKEIGSLSADLIPT